MTTREEVELMDEAATPIDPVLLEKHAEDRIWVLTLNRPHRMNAFGDGMIEKLVDLFRQFRDDRTARVAILTGAGERAFSAGGDLKDIGAVRRANGVKPRSAVPDMVPLSERLELWKPTIAAINGYAIAGGFMLAMQCDIRIMAEHAKAGIAETRWNMAGASWMAPLTRQIGLGSALELALWGDTQLTAQRAHEIGWAQRVVPSDELMSTALAYADRMLDMAPRAVANIKRMLYRGFNMDPVWSMSVGEFLEQNLEGMKDSVEGPTAFAEKRRPNFRDE